VRAAGLRSACSSPRREGRDVLDTLITGVAVLDGTGVPRFEGSVGLRDGRVTTVRRGPRSGDEPAAALEIDGGGSILAPGFIDVHNHSDLAPIVDPSMPSMLRQGVTSVVVGNCGMSPFPRSSAAELALWAGAEPDAAGLELGSFGEFLARIDEAGPAVHVAALVGHGSVRQLAMGLERRAPSSLELRRMRACVAEAMDAGAVGLSTGLIYVPGMYAETGEVVALAEQAAGEGGIYASHVRGEGRALFDAVDEALEIGRRADIPVHLSHLKCETAHVWGRAGELLARVHQASDATGDQYPYAAWASVLSSLLPPWAPVETVPDLLADPASRAALIASIEHGEPGFQSSVDGVGWSRIVIESTADASCNGLDVESIASARGRAPAETCLELLAEDPGTTCIGHAMREDDVRAIVADPRVMVASDAVAVSPDGRMAAAAVHPRTYGTFPRVLGPFVRDGTLTLESAVRKMTSLPADRFGLRERGRIVEGAWADLVMFDAAEIADAATFDRPHRYPEGIEAVFVEGSLSWSAADRERLPPASARRAGHVLRRGSTAR
jgi:N-acyl-D-amino-acid deacylase